MGHNHSSIIQLNVKKLPIDENKYLELEALLVHLCIHKLNIIFKKKYKIDEKITEILILNHVYNILAIDIEKVSITDDEYIILKKSLCEFVKFKLHENYGTNPRGEDLKKIVEKQSQYLGELVRKKVNPLLVYKSMLSEIAYVYSLLLKS